MKTKKVSIALAGIMSAVAIASVMPASTVGTLGSVATVAHAVETTVTWRSADGIFPVANFDPAPFTYNGVTVNTDIFKDYECRFAYNSQSGTFTTSLGNFTKIEIAGGKTDGFSGTGWSGRTWTGKASSVSFDGYIHSRDGEFAITFTIESEDPATVTGAVTDVVANNDGNDNGATAFVTKLTQNGNGEVTVGSVKWDIASEQGSKSFTKTELPTMTFGGDGAEATIALALDGLYDPNATANVTVD